MEGPPLLALLHLCDSLFPLGGFAHSDGLEAATAGGDVRSVDDLSRWMDGCLEDTLGSCDGPAVRLAHDLFSADDWTALAALDAEIVAMRPAAAGRVATRAMGSRLLRTLHQIHSGSALDRLPPECRTVTLPAAFGVVCAAAAIDWRAAVEGFMYLRLAATVSAAMRLMAIGQHDAHTLLAAALARVPAVAGRVIEGGDRPSAFTPVYDIVAMSHQYVHSRLFLS